jgi:hypothetical protein
VFGSGVANSRPIRDKTRSMWPRVRRASFAGQVSTPAPSEQRPVTVASASRSWARAALAALPMGEKARACSRVQVEAERATVGNVAPAAWGGQAWRVARMRCQNRARRSGCWAPCWFSRWKKHRGRGATAVNRSESQPQTFTKLFGDLALPQTLTKCGFYPQTYPKLFLRPAAHRRTYCSGIAERILR